MRAGSSSHERVIVIAGLALLSVALLVALARRDRAVRAPQEIRVVTVPVPMPIERPVPVAPPAPVEPPVSIEQRVVVPVPRPPVTPVRPTPPLAIAAPAPGSPEAPIGTPSASELAVLYRDVGTALQKLDRERPRSVDDLWVRYRWIRLADYLTTPDRRAEGARLLTAIASDARRQ